jgi:hypothetical protein
VTGGKERGNHGAYGSEEYFKQFGNGTWRGRSEPDVIKIADTIYARPKSPSWQRRAPLIGNAHTTAQLLAKHGNLDCRAQCVDIADLLACFRLMGSYNGFEHDKAAREFQAFNRAQYYSDNNCNNGTDAFTYFYGWEGSHVVYIRAVFYNRFRVLSPDWKTEEDMSREDFGVACSLLGKHTDADENDQSSESDNSVTWRLWWD